MSSNLRVDRILPSTGTEVGVGTATGSVALYGDVNIAGTLTYEDVTNIDSVGVVTARAGVHVTGGSVGIGTDNPLRKLDILGTGRPLEIGSTNAVSLVKLYNSATGRSTYNGVDITSNSTAGGVIKAYGGYLDLRTSSSNGTDATSRLHITSDGKVAIGFDAPAVAGLSISNNSTNRGFEFDTGSGFDSTSCIRAYDRPTTAYKSLGLTGSDIKFGINDVEKVRIDSAGRLLLGTVTEGAVNADNFTVADSGNCGITIRSGTSNSGNLYFSDATSGTAEFDGAIAYEQTDSRMMFFTASTERLRITSGGFVNIGADYTQTSRKVMINGGSNVGQLEVKGTEADIWMTSNGPSGGSVWRVMGAVGNTTHRWRVYDSTNSRDCINVYNDGSVVTPVQPRFWARRSTDQTSYDGRNVGGTWIKYDVEEYDIGGNFATSGSDQGRFIAPVDGLYLFQAAAYKQTGTTDWYQSWFDVDGSRKTGTDWVIDASRFAQNSIQIYLTAGQKVGFHPYNNVSSNTILDSHNHTWFKGCLLG